MDSEAARSAVHELDHRLSEDGLAAGPGGTVAVRCDDGIAVSPAGLQSGNSEIEDIPVLGRDGVPVAGDSEPTGQHKLHSGILNGREDVGAVVQVNSPYASAFATLGESIPASHYLIGFIGDRIPAADYTVDDTTDPASVALDTLGADYTACLLRNHGVVATGPTPTAAYEVAQMVEYCARIHYQAAKIGEPSLLPDDEVAALVTLFEDYGTSTEVTDPVAEPATRLESERELVAELGREMLRQDLTEGTGGNVSIRDGDLVAINPSGVPYEDITPETVPLTTVDGDQVAGELAVSSETPMHTAIYRNRDEVGAVVHTHSPYASTFASLDEPVPPSHYLVAFIGDQIPVAGYAPPGTEELGRLAVDALGDDYNACLLKYHGVIATGEDAAAAFETALMVEYCARIHYQARSLGEPSLLDDAEIDTLLERFADYGQQ